MSVLKSELKQLVTHEVGVRVEDALEAAKADVRLLEGRQSAFADGAKAAEGLLAVVDQDLTAELFDLPTATHIKKYVGRCVFALQNLAQQAANQRMAQTGKVQGFQHTVDLLKNMIEAEKAKAAAIAAAESAPPPETPRERVEGTRPSSLKELRLAEDAAESAPVKKRGGRKPRASHT